MRFCWCVCLLLVTLSSVRGEDFTRKQDVVYGRKYGLAMTMDVFTPTKAANGAAVLVVISGGWFSSHDGINPVLCNEFVKRGYTVFAVVHGSQPRFTIPEAVGDLNRAVRFIRKNASEYKIDPERLGVTGGSAGGHLSLMLGTAGDRGDAKAKDEIEKQPSHVQAVACFFPPTDFLNWGEKGKDVITAGLPEQLNLRAPFAFHDFDAEKRIFVPITDEAKRREILKKMSPITHITAETAPSLIIHGDKDRIVPVQQAEVMGKALTEAKVVNEVILRKGADHGWATMLQDVGLFADWFDKHLKKGK